MNLLSDELDRALAAHLENIKTKIEARAGELAGLEGGDGEMAATGQMRPQNSSIEFAHLWQAISEYAPGAGLMLPSRAGVWQRFLDSVAPITIISAFLTVVFAAFGLWAILGAPEAAKGSVQGAVYLDIAKIFAGAIVGSASAAVVSAVKTGGASVPSTRTRAAVRKQ